MKTKIWIGIILLIAAIGWGIVIGITVSMVKP